MYPAFVMADNAKAMYKTMDEIPDSTYFMWMTVGRTYFENLLDYNPYANITRYTKDVLIQHDDRDCIVPLSYSERAAKEYLGKELERYGKTVMLAYGGGSFISSIPSKVERYFADENVLSCAVTRSINGFLRAFTRRMIRKTSLS